jgi:hypothetical protein
MGGIEASEMAIFDKCAEWSVFLVCLDELPDVLNRICIATRDTGGLSGLGEG